MNERCSALDCNGYQCRATAKLTRTSVVPTSHNLELPETVLIFLCPRHFKWSAMMKREIGIDNGGAA